MSGAASCPREENWMKANGMSRMRSQNESVLLTRPQFVGFFGSRGVWLSGGMAIYCKLAM
jgi:hypothetical protein